MAQNLSSAVMAQRNEPHDSLDFFPTPPWATRALIEHVLTGHGWGAHSFRDMTAWDPCAGAGHMVRPLREYFREVYASDIHDYGTGALVHDFLMPGKLPFPCPDFLFFNPPFRLGLEFIEHARAIARQAVCALVRTSFREGEERYRRLFKDYPPLIDAQFTSRVVMAKGRCMDPALLYWDDGKKRWKKPSTATAYSWMVWAGTDHRRNSLDCATVWIPPCRKKLERNGDYDPPVPPPQVEEVPEVLL